MIKNDEMDKNNAITYYFYTDKNNVITYYFYMEVKIRSGFCNGFSDICRQTNKWRNSTSGITVQVAVLEAYLEGNMVPRGSRGGAS